MFLLESPAPTRYDLHFHLGQIPVRVHPLFWLMALLLGGSLGNPLYLLLWVNIVFVSMLVHELGHAFVMRWYGYSPAIVLHVFGGLTTAKQNVSEGRGRQLPLALGLAEQILIPLSGPLGGFLLAGLIMLTVVLVGGQALLLPGLGGVPWPYAFLSTRVPLVNEAIQMALWVNLFWGGINLMPVYPLDGGQVARQLWLRLDPIAGLRHSLWLSLVFAVLLAAAGLFLLRSGYFFLLFGLLAFQSGQSLRRVR